MSLHNPKIVSLIVLSVFLGVTTCCCTQQNDPKKNYNDGELRQLRDELNRQRNDLQTLARICGVSESAINSYSTNGLISEIQSKIEDMDYHGKILSKDDLSYIDEMLSDSPEIIKAIRNYDTFIKKMKQEKE